MGRNDCMKVFVYLPIGFKLTFDLANYLSRAKPGYAR